MDASRFHKPLIGIGLITFCLTVSSSLFGRALPRVARGPVLPDEIKWNNVPEDSRACLKCHMSKAITGSAVRDWQLSKHSAAGVACATCHLPVKEAVAAI